MEYDALRKRTHYGLGRIYEMVINNDPCYAYLQESNAWSTRSWSWPTSTATPTSSRTTSGSADQPQDDGRDGQPRHPRAPAHREARLRDRRALPRRVPLHRTPDRSAQHVSSSAGMDRASRRRRGARSVPSASGPRTTWTRGSTPPEEMERQKEASASEAEGQRHVTPARPTRDVLLFLLRTPAGDWQQDCLSIVRDEATTSPRRR
jgi:stage V sporulation protein R